MDAKQRKEVIATLRAAGREDLVKHVMANKFDDAWGVAGEQLTKFSRSLQEVQRNAPGFVAKDVKRDLASIAKGIGAVDKIIKRWTEEV